VVLSHSALSTILPFPTSSILHLRCDIIVAFVILGQLDVGLDNQCVLTYLDIFWIEGLCFDRICFVCNEV